MSLPIRKVSFIILINFFRILFSPGVYSTEYPGERNDSSVVFIIVLFRHGSRNPEPKFLIKPYDNKHFWPEGWSQLTSRGKKEMYELGLWLKDRYSYLFGDVYSHENIHIVSSDKDRCIMSAQCALAAIYPPTTGQKWHDNFPWQPVPVHTLHSSIDNLLSGGASCPKYEHYQIEMAEKLAKVNKSSLQQSLETYLTQNMNMTVDGVVDLSYVLENLEKMVEKKLSVPEWVLSVYPEPLYSLIEGMFEFYEGSLLYKQLSVGGPLLKDMLNNLLKKKSKTLEPDIKVKMYSGHDYTIMDFLNSIGVWSQVSKFVPHSGAVLLELVEKNLNFYVNILYKNTTKNIYQLIVPGCEPLCSLEKFNVLVSPYVPQDWKKQCLLN